MDSFSILQAMCWLVDGGLIAGTRCWARPCCRCDQRRSAYFASWAAGAYATCCIFLVSWPDRGGQGNMRRIYPLLLFSSMLVRRNCARHSLVFCLTTSTKCCKTFIALSLIDSLTPGYRININMSEVSTRELCSFRDLMSVDSIMIDTLCRA